MFKISDLLTATKGKLVGGNRVISLKGDNRGISFKGDNREISFEGISIDSRTIRRGEVFIAVKGANFDGHDFINQALKKGAGCVIFELRRGYRLPKAPGRVFIGVNNTLKALGDIARFHRKRFDIPVIVVTGSNGKTTTKEMIWDVLSKGFKVLKNEGTKNNHIGLPLTLLELNSSFDAAVLEAGSNHPGEIDYLAGISLPNIAAITNIGPSHLEYFKDLSGVFEEKVSLLKHLRSPHIAVLNADDDLLKKAVAVKFKKPFIITFGIKNNADFFASKVNNAGARIGFSVNNKKRFLLNALGVFNTYNALAAITIARILGMGYNDIIERLSTFRLPQNRLNLVKLNKTQFINDTYNSNPSSLKQALEVLDGFEIIGRKIFIMGDMLELGSGKESFHRQAGERIAGACDIFISVGKLSKFAAEEARDSGLDSKNIFSCSTAKEAKDILFFKILPGPRDLVLVKGSRSMKMEGIIKGA